MGFSWNTAVTACGWFEVGEKRHSNHEQWPGLCFCFMALSCWYVDAQWSHCLLGSVTASVRAFDEVENRLKERFQTSPVLFRNVEVPQGGDWWILGTLKGGHKERSEHCRWRWHDSNFTGCLPRTYRCPSAHLQQRVSVTHSFKSLLLNSTIILSILTKFSFNYSIKCGED